MRRCLCCERIRVQPRPPTMADLPDERIGLYEPAFWYTRIDFLGPLVVKHSKRTRITQTRFKRYGSVFVCLTTRVVHLDLVGDLIRDSFFLALIRFMARRTENSLINKEVKWKFNPPSSPWRSFGSQCSNLKNQSLKVVQCTKNH